MKFNEKLIELRKKQGLSQEEFGNKLNVTRQTVSKWELGQTTPEMDKLVEISKIYNISVDELIKETEEKNTENPVIEDQPIIEENSNNKNRNATILVIALIVVGLLICIGVVYKIREREKAKDLVKDIYNKGTNIISDIYDKGANMVEDTFKEDSNEKYEEKAKKLQEEFEAETEKSFKESEQRHLISTLEMYGGRTTNALEVLDEIITNNKKSDIKITVNFMGQETSNPDEINTMKKSIKTFSSNEYAKGFAYYDVTYDYDENGNIIKATIEEV